jgi:hypothetical protein
MTRVKVSLGIRRFIKSADYINETQRPRILSAHLYLTLNRVLTISLQRPTTLNPSLLTYSRRQKELQHFLSLLLRTKYHDLNSDILTLRKLA